MRHPILLLVSFLFLCVSASTLTAQKVTRITTVEEEVYLGEILSETVDTVKLRSTSGADISIPRASIGSIEYDFTRGKDLDKPFWSIGATFGTPGGINLVLGHNFNNDWGLRLSGGYIVTASGIQIDGLYRLGGETVRNNLYLGAGGLSLSSLGDWTYVNTGYNLQAGGFDLMLGLSVGSGDYSNPQLLFQIGYVHRFRD